MCVPISRMPRSKSAEPHMNRKIKPHVNRRINKLRFDSIEDVITGTDEHKLVEVKKAREVKKSPSLLRNSNEVKTFARIFPKNSQKKVGGSVRLRAVSFSFGK